MSSWWMDKGGPVIAVLASGAAQRFGGGKLQARLGHKPLAAYAIETAFAQQLPVAIIARENETAFWRSSFPSCQIVANRDSARGIGTSIRCAANWAASETANGIILLLADMPFISAGIIEQLAAAINNGQRAACHYPDDEIGIPAAFPEADIPALKQISDHKGAKQLLNERSTLILRPPPGALIDIDTKDELANAHRQLAEGYALQHC